jgi:hypothetical protein
MKLGAHPPSLDKAVTIISNFESIRSQINAGVNDKQRDRLYNQQHYTSYAVALQVVLNSQGDK